MVNLSNIKVAFGERIVFGARASHAAQVQSRVKTIEKIERIVIPPDPKEMKVRFSPVE